MSAPAPRAPQTAIRPALEQRAHDTAVRGLAAPGLLGGLPAARRDARDDAGLLPRSGGAPLPHPVRRQAEGRLGVDLSGVRLHAGAEARDRAQALGANAFALGDEVVLGTGVSPDTAHPVLLHELAHVAQTRTGAAPPIALHDDPPRPRGIGAAPPREPFERGEGVMPETGHVLFERDSADLDPGDVATIEGLMRGRSRRLWVDVYGYASLEGDDAYNANLSAHRGVAVRRAIEPLLPPGSLLDVHAQGEVQDFGPVEENRRVGIRLRDAPELSSIGLLGDFRLQLDPSPLVGGRPDVAPPPAGSEPEASTPLFDPRFAPRFGASLLPSDYAPRFDATLVPPLSNESLFPWRGEGVDWTALARSAALRGQSVDLRDAAAAESLYRGLLPFWSGVFGADIGDWLARRSISSAYESYQYRQNPNQWDRWQQEDEIRGTSVRGLSIDLLDPPWAERKKKKP